METDLFSDAYDSPIEWELGYMLKKHVMNDCFFTQSPKIAKTIQKQHEVNTDGGKFFLDFYITFDKMKIAIECDGKDYHEYYADLYRDAFLLGEKHINLMIRFSGRDLTGYINTCVFFLGRAIPGLISDRNMNALEIEARNEMWNQDFDPEGKYFYKQIFEDPLPDWDDEIRTWNMVRITRRKNFGDFKSQDWCKAYEYIVKNDVKNKEFFVQNYASHWNSGNNLF